MRCNVGEYDTTGYQWKGFPTVVLWGGGDWGRWHVIAFVVLVGVCQSGSKPRAEKRLSTVEGLFDRPAANQAGMSADDRN